MEITFKFKIPHKLEPIFNAAKAAIRLTGQTIDAAAKGADIVMGTPRVAREKVIPVIEKTSATIEKRRVDGVAKKAATAEAKAAAEASIIINAEDFPLYQLLNNTKLAGFIRIDDGQAVGAEKLGRIVADQKEKFEAAQTGGMKEKVEFAQAMFDSVMFFTGCKGLEGATHEVLQATAQAAFSVFKQATALGLRNGNDLLAELRGQSESGFLGYKLEQKAYTSPVLTKLVP